MKKPLIMNLAVSAAALIGTVAAIAVEARELPLGGNDQLPTLMETAPLGGQEQLPKAQGLHVPDGGTIQWMDWGSHKPGAGATGQSRRLGGSEPALAAPVQSTPYESFRVEIDGISAGH